MLSESTSSQASTQELFSFSLDAQSGGARATTFHTAHGTVRTPCFMPVGTKATVKALTPRDLRELGSQIVLANTFHLHLRPGERIIEQLGELHGFMRYFGPILTDSGGFQVFSLADLRKITEQGVTFRSPVDGAQIKLTPERSIEIQRALGADIIMAFDECPNAKMEGRELSQSMERTLRWLERCFTVTLKPHQALFPIVQGGMNPELREVSAQRTVALIPHAKGYAVGGLSVGEDRATTYRMLEHSVGHLPVQRPRYFMGLGTPLDLLEAVDRGIDMFDCVLPTRNARNAHLFHPEGALNMLNAKHAGSAEPIWDADDSPLAKEGITRGYLHHLFKQKEILAAILATQYNIRYLLRLCEEMRQAILENRWAEFRDVTRERLLRK
ncbi:MAG: tRNA guanosine(34) transglycosylase Tgt [Candidatus Sumerlaeia bacterium]|nr:tRNA guanosine(34) transglycosylase Tgt [Candidatus Sumerlaeia bacterium]